jgi:hypothetical protein
MTERYTIREGVLDRAKGYVTKDRNKSYGEPDEDFQRIAEIASAMGFVIDAGDGMLRPLHGSDVALFMIALKLARLCWQPNNLDSWDDIAGYAACGAETAQLRHSRATQFIQDLDLAEFQESKAEPSELSGKATIDPDIRTMAQDAIKGDPTELEKAGYILVYRPNGAGLSCSDRCAYGHEFQTACSYRIKVRRRD